MFVPPVKPHVFEYGIVENIHRVVVFITGSRHHGVLFGGRVEFVHLLCSGLVVALVAQGVKVVACRQKACVGIVFILCVR